MKKHLLTLVLLSLAVGHASPSPSDRQHSCLFLDPELHPPVTYAAGKRLADLDAGEPRTVRLFYFLPNDRPFRADVVQRIKDEMLSIQTWFGEQMEGHGYGYKTFRIETDAGGDPVVHRVDGRHPDSHYTEGAWNSVREIGEAFDLSQSIIVVVVDNSTNRIGRTATGAATWSSKQSGIAMVGGEFAWDTLAHELAHTFRMGHDFRDDSYILSYGYSRNTLSACSAGVLAVHPYFNPDVGVEWTEAPVVELLSATTYPAGSETVPIRLKLSDAHGLQLVRVRVRTRDTHNPRYSVGGTELKTCRGLMGEQEALVEIDYDGVIPSGAAWGFSDLSNPRVHPILLTVVDKDGNRTGTSFDLWELSRQHLATFEVGEEVHGVAFSPGGTTLASGSGEGVELWDLETRRGTTTSLASGVTAVALSADGALLASGFGSGQVQLHDLEGGRVIATLSGHTHGIRSLAFTRDGRILASGADDAIRLWDVGRRSGTATLPVGATAVAFSPDGRTLASASGDGVRLWDVAGRAEVAVYRHGGGGWGSGVNSVVFSPDGTLLASGGDDTTVRLWDVETGEGVGVLEEHDRPVRSVAFSPDGTLLASGSGLAVHLWDPGTKERLGMLRGEGRGVGTVAFSPDAATLAAGTEDGKIGLWDISEWMGPRPRRMLPISGGDQQGTSGEPLAEPLVVEVRDQYGNPLPGVEVTFVVTEGDGRLGEKFTRERTTTDTNGRTEVLLTLGPYPGPNSVEAVISGLERVTFGAAASGISSTGPLDGGYHTWSLPDGARARLGRGLLDTRGIGRGNRMFAFSRDGRLLAITTQVGVWVYDVETAQPLVLLGPVESASSLAFSADGQTLAAATTEGFEVWDVATGTHTAVLDRSSNSPAFVAFSADGATLISAEGNFIRQWDVATGMNTATATLEIFVGNTAAFSPDRTIVAGGYYEGPCRLWDVETGTRIASLEGHTDEVRSVAFSPDGRTLASASADHTVRLWDVAAHTTLATLEGHTSWVESVEFSPDGRTLASGASDRTIKLWEVATGTETASFEGHGSWVRSVAFSPDGKTLASGEQRGTVMLWGVATGNATVFTRDHVGTGRIASLALSPDGETLASGSRDLAVRLWDIETGANTANLEGHRDVGHPDWILALDFSPDGRTLASGSSDNTVRLWDVATGANTRTLEAPEAENWVSRLVFSHDGEMIAAGHKSGMIRLWETATGTPSVDLEAHTEQIGSLAFSRDDRLLLSGASDRTVRVWDIATGGQSTLLEVPDERVVSVAFSPDGLPMAFGGSWRRVELWDVATGGSIGTLSGVHTGSASAAALSPDGGTYVFGEFSINNFRVEVWDLAEEENIATLNGHSAPITAVAYARDRPIFASGSTDGSVLVWDMRLILPHPKSLAKLAGDEQEGTPGLTLAEPFVIEVRDQKGQWLRGAEVSFAVTSGGGTLSVERATTNLRGQASTTLTLGNAPGPNTVVVEVEGVEPVTFTAHTRSIPTTLGKIGGDGQHGPGGASLPEPLVVSLLDQAGSPLAGVAVSFEVTAGGGTLSATTATTDPEGRAASTLTLGRTPGSNSVRVTVAGLAPVTFTALGVAVPRSLTKLSGDEQQATGGEQLGAPLVVSVRDQNGSAYPGAVVTFALTGDGGNLSVLTDTTGAEGRAATILTLGDELGAYTVVATVTDLEPVTFTATAKASPDFDGDGEVGFGDFFLFAEAFGGGDPRFDLDASGTVDFADFFLFAEHFGQPARAKLVAMARERIGLPEGPGLQQNAPNPFNSQTVIPWLPLEAGVARLEVFALTGQRVAVLHAGPQQAGFHRFRWDGRDDQGRMLASGVYVYRLVTAEAVQTRKLTLLR